MQTNLMPISLNVLCSQFEFHKKIAFIRSLAIRQPEIFVNATTAQLSCHVKKFVAITLLELRRDQSEISIKFEL